jgi:putative phage-type endonuclease
MPFTPAQLAERRTGVGASEVAAILGLSKFRRPMDVYLEKRGLVDADPSTEVTRWGTLLEDVIAMRYCEWMSEAHGIGVWVEGDGRTTVRKDGTPWFCTPDRIVHSRPLDENGTKDRWLLQVKNTMWPDEWGEAGTDEIPDEYLVQVQWEMMVTGMARCDVAVLFRGNEFRVYTVDAKPALQALLVEQVKHFWNETLAGNPPPLDASDATRRYLLTLYPKQRDDDLLLTSGEVVDRVMDYAAKRAAFEAAEAAKVLAENELKAIIGEKSGLMGPWGRITWRAGKDIEKQDKDAVIADLRNLVPLDRTAEATDIIQHRHKTVSPAFRRFLYTPAKGG